MCSHGFASGKSSVWQGLSVNVGGCRCYENSSWRTLACRALIPGDQGCARCIKTCKPVSEASSPSRPGRADASGQDAAPGRSISLRDTRGATRQSARVAASGGAWHISCPRRTAGRENLAGDIAGNVVVKTFPLPGCATATTLSVTYSLPSSLHTSI